MRLFRRKPSREREVAAALSARGVGGVATVVALRPTGATREGAAREIELTLDVQLPRGERLRVVHRQFMNRYARHGLAPGEPARILYDPDDPRVLLVRGHPRVRTEVIAGEIVIVDGTGRDEPGAVE
ncbi:hypothetical protein [Conexibacter woesei]|uniref:Uncharacterized protein n=1 Tax=Conexibacter woesei (strain DSM 14684 / CCUG 47730 / CIP 108061 / JCM 11494 / NBRC 100937 / ID131577) TaxID=469383 RepID=D3F0N6_CONWI|nr:hypothetical protein [Conexibacter woesei]ADB53970.1 hypothetical protein Cwoe_5565 [Conexibacter woesei DSM 14684]